MQRRQEESSKEQRRDTKGSVSCGDRVPDTEDMNGIVETRSNQPEKWLIGC